MEKHTNHIFELFILSSGKFPENAIIQLFWDKSRFEVKKGVQFFSLLELFPILALADKTRGR